MKEILFICTHNSARSQMAEGLVNTFHKDKYKAYSAGTTATKINPYVVNVLSEIGKIASVGNPLVKNRKHEHNISNSKGGMLQYLMGMAATVCYYLRVQGFLEAWASLRTNLVHLKNFLKT